MQISSSLKKTQAQLEATFSNCFDVTLRPLTDTRGRKILVLFVDGLVKKETIQEEIIRPLLGFAIDADDLRIKNLEELRRRLLTPVTIQPEPDYDAAVTHILSGDTLVFLDGCTSALCVQTRGWMSRSISAPDTQRAVRGPKEGFTETLLFNTAMLRRKIRSPRLKTEIMQLGDISRTDVCLTYLEGDRARAGGRTAPPAQGHPCGLYSRIRAYRAAD